VAENKILQCSYSSYNNINCDLEHIDIVEITEQQSETRNPESSAYRLRGQSREDDMSLT